MGYLIDILIGAASRIMTGELSAHVEAVARWITSKAADYLPPDDRERFREEWLAHLNETPGTLRKLWHALGCHLGAGKVAGVLAQQTKRRHEDVKILTVEKSVREAKLFLLHHHGHEYFRKHSLMLKVLSEDELKAWGIIPRWAFLKKEGE